MGFAPQNVRRSDCRENRLIVAIQNHKAAMTELGTAVNDYTGNPVAISSADRELWATLPADS